ncbi:hypothetical protein SJI19_16670 [Acerihabitans sp. TG2]|uniref:hypothetical protein n=1 Tax=Acerihabitans sp. TG2 TaxID=3096008 RepID=UPI002B23E11F|nr:hypothetical protein [Acerihabitans sp. TG2]MEA9392159.1 hypothetical protein [Acerihabitans sp. TG2]
MTLNITQIEALFNAYCFNFTDEIELQDAIEKLLISKDVRFSREVRLSAKDKPDFVLELDCGKVALEIKTGGTKNALLRQINRYLNHNEIFGVLVAGTPYFINQLPLSLNNKPVWSHRCIGSLLR